MKITIRPARVEDAQSINDLRRMPGVFENILGMPSENLKRNEEFLQNMDADSHQFVAIITDEAGKERIIGMAGLSVRPNPRLRHSADLGIMVHKDYQGCGVGNKLMETLIDLADNWLMLIRIELGVYTDNEHAINMYKKFGFEAEGVNRKAAVRNGQYVDTLMMARLKNSVNCKSALLRDFDGK
ncbi:MAG: GNAT family N-acetyltransferase [Firmicutes bacterium]|nr:GNAT family N-acetyltransferase [Bacillota bacterium]